MSISDKKPQSVSLTKLLLPMVRSERRGLSILLALVVAGAVITALLPWPLKLIVDHVVGDKPLPAIMGFMQGWFQRADSGLLLIVLVVVGLMLHALMQVTKLLEGWTQSGVAERLSLTMGERLLTHLQHLSPSYHAKNKSGDLVRRVTTDARFVEDLVLGVMLPLLASLFTLGTMFIIMFNMNREMTLIALLAAVPIPFMIRLFAPQMAEKTYTHQKSEGNLISVAEQTLSGLPVVQAFGQQSRQYDNFRTLSEGTMRAYLDAIKSQLKFSVGVSSSTAVGSAMMMVLGGVAVLKGTLSIGELLVFLAYVASLYGPVEALSYLSSVYASAKGRALRVQEVLSTQPDVTSGDEAVQLTAPGTGISVQLQNIVFSYEEGSPVLSGVSVNADAGQSVALVGGTGSGKSTLVSLLPRFFDPDSGQVSFNNKNVVDLSLESVRNNISMVLQDAYLLPVSVADNIAYGKPDATRNEIVQAAKNANADEFISRLPDGYDTILTEQASDLSGGQKQRIAIARALLKDAPIVILDEPTSALDARSEQLFLEAIKRLMQGRTTFIIAHRLSTIQHADQIVVLDQGQIIEQGSHQELVEKRGYYYALLNCNQATDERAA